MVRQPADDVQVYELSPWGYESETAIQELGMGTNSKLHVQFWSRHWNTLGCNGETYSDRGYQNTWEVSRGQRGASGILVLPIEKIVP